MPEPTLVVFDDLVARDWMPLALTRPVGELRFGAYTLRERAEQFFRLRTLGHVTHAALRPFDEPGCLPVLDAAGLRPHRDLVLLSSRAVLSGEAPDFGGEPELLAVAGEICGAYVPAGTGLPEPDFFENPAEQRGGWRVRELGGERIDHVWELVTRDSDRLVSDIAAKAGRNGHYPNIPAGVHLLGSEPLILGNGVEIDPAVVFDLRQGPIWVESGAVIRAFTHLTGPAYVGSGTTLLGGRLTGINAGPRCKIHGEVEASVFLGYSNKAHDGFLGHAYVGRWVNLGALTTNSDLKNNYGGIRMWTPSGVRDTGETKLGCLLGDHVKTAIGTILPTGMVVGAGSNLFGEGPAPTRVPAFSWGTRDDTGGYEFERFVATAAVVMARRGVELSAGQRDLLRSAWGRRADG